MRAMRCWRGRHDRRHPLHGASLPGQGRLTRKARS
ncbi:Uncharacterised protein [Bordetella ansorpii]|uniref:Uncharacterized protein n=1 Tax=Bordetella ansorpii TaxID=288768 RepID=A0A157S6D7_9BORD|nr:Uncharacterised protein [Bordetella ansorpii]